MRLSKIKLAGFKTFVDPTTIPLPSNLVAVVGPNGCGKSNVIDAVRWVMGESSAKNLRGDSMTDVIFNGSSSRKPVGQASIELVFDNSDGTLGGQYAQYNEIAIKRVVTRDGQSSYFLNGTRCRRRDITDIFLGTGLGPRSYAIIEQGTISRLIEARPEEMRVFLEEAAGISKYKERRRETENRIRHTRENLDRLNDLREELDKQLDRLQRQAKTAERYKALKEEERQVKGELQALRWKGLDQHCHEQEGLIRERETALEAEIAKQRNYEAEIEKQRELHVEATEAFNQVQGRFYGVGADIARLEQAIQHTKERRRQQEQDLAQLEQAWHEAERHLDADQRKIEELTTALEEGTPALEQAQEAEQLSAAALAEAEQAMQEWQQQWEEFNQRYAEPSQTAQVERTRLQNLEQQSVQMEQRRTRLEQEQQGLSLDKLEEDIAQLQGQLETVETESTRLQEGLAGQVEQLNTQRERNHEYSTRLDETRSRLQSLRGRQASLEALQQAALGKQQGAVSTWLSQQHLQDAERLAEGLQVEKGWERAVEAVLGNYLEAVCVDGLDPVVAALQGLDKGTLTLFDTRTQSSGGLVGDDSLVTKVKAPWPLDALLGGVYCAADLNEALAMRGQLGSHESVVTRDGIWLGPSWLRVVRDADEKAGVLEREQELKELADEIAQLAAQSEELQHDLAQGREVLRNLEEAREQQQREVNQVNRQAADIKAQLSGRQARMEQLRQRVERVTAELTELQQQTAENIEQQGQVRQRLNEALALMEELAIQREELQEQRNALREALEQNRERARNDREAAHQISLRLQTMRTELTSTQQGLERMTQQREQFAARREELQLSLAEGDAPLEGMNAELEEMLAKRSAVEAEMAEARKQVEEIDHAMREFGQERSQAELRVQEMRGSLDQARMTWQEHQVRRQTLKEQLDESDYEIQALFDTMPEEANEQAWQSRLAELGQKIQRLGPINLAAIEEYEQQSERKVYLDAQNNDLMEALETLENAIRKIDRETRTRFKETYDKVNNGLQAMFPRLFGGGHAYLELTGEDLLDAGVSVMARPPGKRNSTIHLLSGGEKALTAVALVFSIFQLNPAPFCMLDEVDAPLDDANVGRFCKMVEEMSDRTQFIFITHNKVTMELAQQLNGITMREPGVSRLVAVDIDEAAELAVANG